MHYGSDALEQRINVNYLSAVKGLGTFLPAHAAYQNCNEIIHSCK